MLTGRLSEPLLSTHQKKLVSPWQYHKEKILLDLSSQQLTVIDDFLPLDVFRKLSLLARRDYEQGLLKPATIGRFKKLQEKVRGDKVRWLERAESPSGLHPTLDLLDEMRVGLQQELFLPLNEHECHFAVYPPGSRYVKHLDCHKNQQNRILSFIIYLNRRNWSKDNGGQLKVYLKGDETIEINPCGNRLVMFDSSRFYHEVLSASRERVSFTGWFRRQNVVI